MPRRTLRLPLEVLVALLLLAAGSPATRSAEPSATAAPPADGATIKAALGTAARGENLLRPDAWTAYEQGFQRDGAAILCDNGAEPGSRRGAVQTIELRQTRPEPIAAVAWSKAEGVTGSADADYSIYLDLEHDDGTPLYGQTAAFATASHDWQRREVLVLPQRPVKRVRCYLLLRGHGGKASFRDAELRVVRAPAGASLFDGVPVACRGAATEGFQVRDVAAASDFVRIDRQALGLKLDVTRTPLPEGESLNLTLSDTTGKDRAVTLLYAVPVEPRGLRWLEDPRRSEPVEPGREYCNATRFRMGTSGRLSRYPLGAVADRVRGTALGIDMGRPAFFRVGYHAGTGELYLAWDLGLAPENPSARLAFCRFSFDPEWGFRGALARYCAIFPEAFTRRVSRQGLWMPFAAISKVPGWEDFGFRFKEGDDETAWDDAHGVLTFRYTEPMTWWMTMPKEMPRTMEAAEAEAKRLAAQGDPAAKAWLTSAFHDASGGHYAMLLDTPWCNGACWSINSMPGIPGEATDFRLKWNPDLKRQLYESKDRGELDGEYVDSSEGYSPDELDFRRDHLAAARTPLVFDSESHRPAIFRGLVAFEYVRALAEDVHGMGKLMMANSTPSRLCWLAPMLDVAGTETNWNPGGQWQPLSDGELLYRRALCKGKPYCFLMNTEFERFPRELVEKYMKRCLAYGMFPGFFSHNASEGHYFARPELYDRDRPLFKRYMPLCKLVAEAGWEPIPLARSSDDRVHVERFGDGGARYLTVLNDSPEPRTAVVTLEGPVPSSTRELLADRPIDWSEGQTTLTLQGEDVMVLELRY